MIMKKKLILSFLLIAALQYGKAQISRLKFDHITQQDGLPDDQVRMMKQDEDGYIWIGTQLGLVRYDGYSITILTLDKKQTDIGVMSMTADGQHNLWFGTDFGNGLYRYNRDDGSLTPFPYPGARKQKDFYWLNLRFSDNQGNLWGIGGANEKFNVNNSGMEVIKFIPKEKRYEYFDSRQKGAHNVGLNCIFQSIASGRPIWAGSENGLNLYDEKAGTFKPYVIAKDGSAQRTVYGITEANAEPGILWLNVYDRVLKKSYIARVDTRDKSIDYYNHLTSPNLTAGNDTVNAVYEDGLHRVWLATENGLTLFNSASQTFTPFIPADTVKGVRKNQLYNIADAKNGMLWINSGKGLLNFNMKTHLFQRVEANHGQRDALSSNDEENMFIDRSGILWASNGTYGADKLNTATSAFSTIPVTARDGSAYNPGDANDFIVTKDGYCLFTNNDGIFKWKPGAPKTKLIYKIKKGDIGLDGVVEGNDGKLYFGNGNGLQVYDAATYQQQSYACKKDDPSTISSKLINCLLQGRNGLIWIGTADGGVCNYNPVSHRFKRYLYRESEGGKSVEVPDTRCVNTLYEDRQGTIWAGFNGPGLTAYNSKTLETQTYLINSPIYIIEHILENPEGGLWLGTYTQGLFEFDPKTQKIKKHFKQDNGLLCNSITGIVEDKRGFLWIASTRGLTRLDTMDMSVKNFPINTILPGKTLLTDDNFKAVNDSLMVLVLTDGIALFKTSDLGSNPYPPDVHIEKMNHSNPGSTSESVVAQPVFGINRMELPYNQNRLTFDYIALHYADPSRNIYAYRLDGYDNHWIQAGAQRSATYTNLSPGAYTFHVRAANSDGIWNEKGASIIVIINPPWWQTWWAWVLWIVLFVLAVYSFIAYRSRKLLYDKKILEHKVQVRTEEVMQQKEEIESQRDSLERAFEELKTTQTQLIQSEKMASLGELTAGIAHEIQNPLNFVNNFSEVSVELLAELKEEEEKGNKEDVISIANDLTQNLEKIRHHGKRADAIVKGMLQHSQSGSGAKEPTNINALAEEYLRLSYHGLRSKDKAFNAEVVTHFDEKLPQINVVQQDIGRVLLNLFNNAFYAVNQKQKTVGADYKQEVSVSTSTENGQVVIRVKDNGVGIPDVIKEKIMQPFFTTKPTGEGTGLGLSLSYDMVVKGHGGNIQVNSVEGEGSEFIISLPLN